MYITYMHWALQLYMHWDLAQYFDSEGTAAFCSVQASKPHVGTHCVIRLEQFIRLYEYCWFLGSIHRLENDTKQTHRKHPPE